MAARSAAPANAPISAQQWQAKFGAHLKDLFHTGLKTSLPALFPVHGFCGRPSLSPFYGAAAERDGACRRSVQRELEVEAGLLGIVDEPFPSWTAPENAKYLHHATEAFKVVPAIASGTSARIACVAIALRRLVRVHC